MRTKPSDDRTTRARIRDAAIAWVAEQGLAAMTARRVAAKAGVSAGSVIHHFGSMENLRAECDGHVAAVIRQAKEGVIAQGPSMDVLAALRESGMGPLAGYLAAVLADDSPAVERLVDELLHDAVEYVELSVETGISKPTDDPRGRAATMLLWSLGAFVMHKHMRRILGVDITDPSFGSDPAAMAYVGPAYEILGGGIFTEAFTARVRNDLVATPGPEPAREP